MCLRTMTGKDKKISKQLLKYIMILHQITNHKWCKIEKGIQTEIIIEDPGLIILSVLQLKNEKMHEWPFF